MREAIIVADSSPLIALARIDQLDLLSQLGSRILAPQAVWEEAVIRDSGAPGASEISQATWIEIQAVDPLLVEALQANGIWIRQELIDAVLREVGE